MMHKARCERFPFFILSFPLLPSFFFFSRLGAAGFSPGCVITYGAEGSICYPLPERDGKDRRETIDISA